MVEEKALESSDFLKPPSLDDKFKRYNPEQDNWLKYTPLEMSERKQAIKAMEKDYPHLPPSWCDMVFDFVHMKGKKEIDRIINSKEFEKKSSKKRDTTGGVVKGALVIEDAPTESHSGEQLLIGSENWEPAVVDISSVGETPLLNI